MLNKLYLYSKSHAMTGELKQSISFGHYSQQIFTAKFILLFANNQKWALSYKKVALPWCKKSVRVMVEAIIKTAKVRE